jgi:hypothetical protein
MTKHRMSALEPSSERRELTRLVRHIQALTLELQELEARGPHSPAASAAKHRRLDQLRWQLAATARRSATEVLGNAA